MVRISEKSIIVSVSKVPQQGGTGGATLVGSNLPSQEGNTLHIIVSHGLYLVLEASRKQREKISWSHS